MHQTNRVVVALGSNIDKEVNLPKAVGMLRAMCEVVGISAVYETIPVGLLNQPNFLNAAILLETDLSPSDFKTQILAQIEIALNRVRLADKNAPRTIDCDIALWNDDIVEYDGRSVPDPDILKFPHVTVPIANLDPFRRHPETGEPLGELASRLVEKMRAKNEGEPPLWVRDDIQV